MRPVNRSLRVLSLAGFAVLLRTLAASADGCFVWKNRAVDITEPAQKALIFHDQGREDLVLSVRFEGAPEEFGWIVPLPSVPELFAEDSLLFSLLSQATQKRQFERSRRGEMLHRTMGVEVVSSQRVGIYQTQVVDADAGGELHEWLRARGYQLPIDAEPVLDRYLRDGWVFATLKIVPGAIDSTMGERLHAGTIPPIRFRFLAPEPVFPLEISSVMPGGTEVLLYILSRNLIVPATPKPESWSNQVNSRAGEHHWIYQYEHETRAARFLPDYREPFFLTKHRIRLDPGEMADVRFVPFDPVRGLRSAVEAERLEAIAFLGRMKPAGALELLRDRLHGDPTRTESMSLLWALGELGGPAAEAELLPWLENPDPVIGLEAVEALGRMCSRAALPHLIRGLEPGTGEEAAMPYGVHSARRRACLDWLMVLGDSTCLDPLRSLAKKHEGWKHWNELARPGPASRPRWMRELEDDPGLRAVAALAACGDAAARAVLVRAVVTGGEDATSPIALSLASTGRGSYNGFPSGFWTGECVLMKSSFFRHWEALTALYSFFAAAPRLRTSFLEEAAAQPQLPGAGAIVLLGNADSLSAWASGRLMQIWHESLQRPREYIYVTVESMSHSTSEVVRYNFRACAVAYAFARHGRAVELARVWASRPGDDPVLEAELVFAMAQTGDPRFRKIVVEYVRRVWGAAARSDAVARDLAASVSGRVPSRLSPSDLRVAAFDLGYRGQAIWGYLFGPPADFELEKSILTDRGLPPYLRLAILSQVNFHAAPRERLLPAARAEVEALRRDLAGGDTLLAQVADSVQAWLARTARSIDGRNAGAETTPSAQTLSR